jgi:prophage regulatory protein
LVLIEAKIGLQPERLEMHFIRQAMRRRAVEAATGIPKPTMYRKIAEGTFPKGTKISPRVVVWYQDEIAAWQRGDWPAVKKAQAA